MAERKLTDGERISKVQQAFMDKLNQVLDFIPGYRGYRRGVENVVGMIQGQPNRYSVNDYIKDLGYSMVPFYSAYDNYINDQLQDWKMNAIEAAMLALPIKGNMRGIVGRDGKVRYVADDVVRPDPVKGAEFERLADKQVEPYRGNIRVEEVDGPYFQTPDYDQRRLLHYENSAGSDFHYPSEYIDEALNRNYSNKSLNPQNVNRTMKDEYRWNPDELELVERGTPEWDNIKANADAYKKFVTDNFNDRSSLVGYSGPNPSDRTPYEIYEGFMNERGVPSDYHTVDPMRPESYDQRFTSSQMRRDNYDVQRDLEQYMRANNDAMRLSDYKNIAKSLEMNIDNADNISLLRQGVERYPTNELFTEADKQAVIREIEETVPLINAETDPVKKNTMINMLINEIGAMGLWYK